MIFWRRALWTGNVVVFWLKGLRIVTHLSVFYWEFRRTRVNNFLAELSDCVSLFLVSKFFSFFFCTALTSMFISDDSYSVPMRVDWEYFFVSSVSKWTRRWTETGVLLQDRVSFTEVDASCDVSRIKSYFFYSFSCSGKIQTACRVRIRDLSVSNKQQHPSYSVVRFENSQTFFDVLLLRHAETFESLLVFFVI